MFAIVEMVMVVDRRASQSQMFLLEFGIHCIEVQLARRNSSS